MRRHKSAISITLDNDVLDFFSGKGRSGKINHILRQYLRSKLENNGNFSLDDRTNKQIIASALAVCQQKFGFDHIISKILDAIYGEIDD